MFFVLCLFVGPVQVDVDDPDPSLLSPPSSHHRVESPEYRQTVVAGASTPPAQRIVWLVCNVPGPTLMHNGHLVAEWDVDTEEIEKKQGQKRRRRGKQREQDEGASYLFLFTIAL
jgi:hypothetical protein